MATILRLVSGGVTLVDFNVIPRTGSSYANFVTYTPVTPEVTISELETSIRDGSEILSTSRRNVTETVTIRLSGSTEDNIISLYEKIDLAIKQAEESQFSSAPEVYIEYAPNNTSDVYRSEFLTGKLDIVEGAMDSTWKALFIDVNLTWTRAYFWELNVELQVPLRSLATPTYSSSVYTIVYNSIQRNAAASSGVLENVVRMNAVDVKGSIPTPIRLELINKTTTDTGSPFTRSIREMIIGHNAFAPYKGTEPAPFFIQAESGTGSSAATPASEYSDDQAKSILINTADFTRMVYWKINHIDTGTDGLFTNSANAFYRMIAKFPFSTGGYAFFALYGESPPTSPDSTYYWKGPTINLYPHRFFQDMGAVKLPPYKTKVQANDFPMYLALYMKTPTNPITVTLDFIYFMPLQGFRKLFVISNGPEYNQVFQIDENQETAWTQQSSGLIYNFAMEGKPIYLWPGKNQQIAFFNATNSYDEKFRSLGVKAFYRPRRLTI